METVGRGPGQAVPMNTIKLACGAQSWLPSAEGVPTCGLPAGDPLTIAMNGPNDITNTKITNIPSFKNLNMENVFNETPCLPEY